ASETGDDGHVVAGLFGPAARRPDDFSTNAVRGNIAGRPDMVEPPATIGRFPILAAIAPPGIELLVVRQVLAHQISPAMTAIENGVEGLGLERGVADDLEQLLVAPDVILVRRDIEVAGN